MGTFATYARTLFDNGYSIIPLNGKRPFLDEWQQYCERTPTEEEITEWEKKYPDCNIGLPGGPANGVAWFDCDSYTQTYSQAVVDHMPIGQIWRIGSKGFVTPIKFMNQRINKIHYKNIEMGDVLGLGKQVAAFGKHPDTGQEYKWHAHKGLLDLTRDELVDLAVTLTDDDILKLESQLNEIHFDLDPRDLERAKAKGSKVASGGRNDRLKAVCGAMFERGCQLDEVVKELLRTDLREHKEPLFTDKKEFEDPPEVAALKFATSIFSTFVREKSRRGEAVPQLTTKAEGPVHVIEFARNRQGGILGNADNVVRALEGMPNLLHFWYDEFYDRIRRLEQGGSVREWRDTDDTALLVYLQREVGIQASLKTVQHSVELVAFKRQCNEPRDWMGGLTWDKTERIDECFVKSFGAEESEYTRRASRNWWIAMAARVHAPGCKFDNMVVLEGGQGKFKSTALGIIGGQWFLESGADITSKDFFQCLRGKILVEIAELDGFKGAANEKTIKRVLSTRIDTYRPSYGRRSGDYGRQCVFVGTTNEHEYLDDATGGRRFWPIRIGDIDLERLSSTREQLFAEAVFKYKRGDSWWEMPASAAGIQAERNRSDSWADPILAWLTGREGSVKVIDIATNALSLDMAQVNKGVEMRIASILRNLGWDRDSHRTGKVVTKVWVRTESAQDYDPSRPITPSNIHPFKRW